jgi:hypothetical protein
MSYAENTTVPVERSRIEIETLLRKYGADQFAIGWEEGKSAAIQFRAHHRIVRFVLPMPDPTDRRFTHYWRGTLSPVEVRRTDAAAKEHYEQDIRRRWRALALVVKAKLEAVASEITTFEDEFLAHIVMPDGSTVADHVRPSIESAYQSGKMPPGLLPGW